MLKENVQIFCNGGLVADEVLAAPFVAHAINYPNATINPDTLFLLEKIADIYNLDIAFKKVKANKGAPGVDKVSVGFVADNLNKILADLHQQLLEGKYSPLPVRRVGIPKPAGGVRNLGIPTVIDRIVQQAILQILNPIIDPTFSEFSFGFRKQRSVHLAIKAAQQHIEEGYDVTVSIDLAKCFDTFNHDILINQVRKYVSDKRVLKIIGKFLRAGILDKGSLIPTTKGTPQGGPLSPLLSNLYLDPVDKLLEARGHRFVRYADDLTIFVKSPRSAQRVFENISRFLERKLKLEVNKAKSEINTNYTLILGLLLRKDNALFIPTKKIAKFKAKIKSLTRRQNGRSILQTITAINPLIRGWYQSVKIAQASRVLKELDCWIKRRFRAIFLKQCKRKKTIRKRLLAKGLHPRLANSVACSSKGIWRLSKTWGMHVALNNQFFDDWGLFSMSAAYQKL